MLKKIKAFTLAETLITLGIIGVIAAIVIPPLLNNYPKQEYVNGLKKNYSEISQMFKNYIADEGVENLSQTKLLSTDPYSDESQTYLNTMVRKYFKIIDSCKMTEPCKLSTKLLDNSGYASAQDTNAYAFYTTAGTYFSIALDTESSCTPNYSIKTPMKGNCGTLYIDVNGAQQPNKLGRDGYMLMIGPDGNLFPYYGISYAQYNTAINTSPKNPWTSYTSVCGTAGSPNIEGVEGWGCAARIIEEGWEMNY